jgi:hypothetical protein
MDASPAKRRVLGALDPNACSPKVRSDGKAQLSPVKAKAVGTRPVLSPTRASTSPSSTPQKDAESRKRSSPTPAPEETVSRAGGDEELDSEPAPKRPCLDSNVREDAQPRRAKVRRASPLLLSPALLTPILCHSPLLPRRPPPELLLRQPATALLRRIVLPCSTRRRSTTHRRRFSPSRIPQHQHCQQHHLQHRRRGRDRGSRGSKPDRYACFSFSAPLQLEPKMTPVLCFTPSFLLPLIRPRT